MAHLLMIESWVGASGNLLPPLLRELGHSYTFVTRKASHYQNPMSSEKHAVFRYADDVVETETNDLQQLIESVRHVRFDGVITVCDYYIETVCEVAKAYNVPCPFSANVKTARQKHLMRQAVDRAGLSNPKYMLAYNWEEVEKAAQEIGYPLVLKPVDLASSAFVKLIQTSNDLQQAYRDLENFPLNFRDQERERAFLIEEYICGEEVSVETVSNNGEITVVGITDKSVTGSPYFIENGHMFPAKLDEDVKEEIGDYVRNVLLATGYDHGIAHTEIKLTKDGPKVVEINPRTAGNYIVELIEYVTGVNMLKAFVSLALGQQPSVTVSDTGGRTLSGQTLEAFLASVQHANIFSVGLNCSFGARQLKPFLEQLAARAPYYISAYPNAGLPNSLGQYDQTPADMAHEVKEYIQEGLINIIGGCCGTTDAYIAEYPALIAGAAPHVPAPKPESLWLSGLELLEVTPEKNFINVGERCNVAGSRKFLRLVNEKKYDEALSIARQQVEDGAQIIDVNMDDGLLDAQAEMTTFLNLIASEPEIARVPVMIDSSKWDVIVAGLKCLQGKSIVNSISLKEGEEKFLEHARTIRQYGAATVVMAFDEKGQADTYERKIEVCARAYQLLVEKVGFNPHDIIFDPNVLAVATGMDEHNNYAVDFIRATGWIRKNLPGAHVSGGVSNLSFSFRGNNYIREAMHAVFLYHAIREGMDMGIVNPATAVLYTDIPADILERIEDVVLNRRLDAAERLIETAEQLKAAAEQQKGNATDKQVAPLSWRNGTSVEERLKHALTKGIGDYLEEDLAEALKLYPKAVDIIEGPLMAGMNYVGELFGAGKMFLPQVVKTARTMKKAVAILQPVIEAEKQEGSASAGKVLLATVKGDVHDIGKNIVSVVMACNGYEIIDLGVMVPAETIVQRALEEKVDMIGLSGLITPSLEEMVHVAMELEKAGADIPLLIGGATTSRLHTALKIAPVYHAPVVHLKDASQNATVAARLMNPKAKEELKEKLSSEYQQLREKNAAQAPKTVPLEEAQKNKLNLF